MTALGGHPYFIMSQLCHMETLIRYLVVLHIGECRSRCDDNNVWVCSRGGGG